MTRARVRDPDTPWRVLFCGQSMNWLPAPPDNYPTRLMSGRSIPWVNLAGIGIGWDDLDDPADFDEVEAQTSRHGGQNIAIMCGGTSDIVNGFTGQQVYDLESAYATSIRALGVDHVIAVTMPDAEQFTAGQRTERGNHNTLLLADADEAFDAVVDIGIDDWDGTPLLDQTEDPVLHLTAAGAQHFADLVTPALDSLLGEAAPSGVLDDFDRADGAPGDNWTQPAGPTSPDNLVVASNTVTSDGTGIADGYWNADTYPQSAGVSGTVGASGQVGLYLGLTSPGASVNGYLLYVPVASDEVWLFEVTAGSETQVGSTVNATVSDGDRFRMRRNGDDIEIDHDTGGGWSNIFTETDTTHTADGNIGVHVDGSSSAVDDFGFWDV